MLRYLIWSKDAKLTYQKSQEPQNELYGYVDANYAGDLNKRKSLTGYVFLYESNLISWKASLQPIVALSTSEVEYMALTEAIKGLWLKSLMKDLGLNQTVVKIYCNNQNAIHLLKNPQYHTRTKHINIKYHFVWDKIEELEIEVLKVYTSENVVDMLKKPVSKLKLLKCLELIGFNLPETG